MAVALEPHIWVSDFWVMLDWYRDVLGFEPTQWVPSGEDATWCELKHDPEGNWWTIFQSQASPSV